MGKGGEQSVSAGSKKPLKLDHLETEVLRKWAKAYGLKEDKDRKVLLEELNPFADGILDKNRPANPPLAPPTFTLKMIKDAIPEHCFKRSLTKSLGYLATDLIKIAIFGYLATYISSPALSFLPNWSPYVLWPLYWFIQGSVMTGVWVLAHECGHQSFSESELANNIVGTICHSLLLVPYHPWRVTHGLHHNNTGSCENDEVFTPTPRSAWAGEMLRETPLANLWGIFIMLTVGWIPGYLVFNATGPEKYKGKNANHFSPTAVFFKPSEYWLVVQSNIAWFAALGLLIVAINHFGFSTVWCYYIAPYLIVNKNLVLITYLQHTDVFVPHFRGAEWNWLRGAVCTVDRDFGFLMNRALHHITDTHVCHHLFSKMPFYHAEEATVHIKRVLGPYYLYDATPISTACYRSFSCCQFVEDADPIVFYKNIK